MQGRSNFRISSGPEASVGVNVPAAGLILPCVGRLKPGNEANALVADKEKSAVASSAKGAGLRAIRNCAFCLQAQQAN